jgi:Uma2 family endonuclease
MNDLTPMPGTTRGAEGLPRRRWSVAEILKLVEVGIIRENERFELIDGEIVPMSPKGAHHENLKSWLNIHFARALPANHRLVTETTLYTTDFDFLEPDFVVWPEKLPLKGLKPKDLTLLVEVSDSSLRYDTGRKAQLYAGLGLREYWVINARNLITRVYLEPKDGKFRRVRTVKPTTRLVPTLVPALALRLADLAIDTASDD